MPDQEGVTYPEMILGRYSIVDADDVDSFSFSWEEVLYARSALEFIREQLPERTRKLMDEADAFWRSHPMEFNRHSKVHHAGFVPAQEMTSWVVDSDGNTPKVPESHWWWRRLPRPVTSRQDTIGRDRPLP